MVSSVANIINIAEPVILLVTGRFLWVGFQKLTAEVTFSRENQ